MRKKDILLNIPNCIGYLRIALLICSSVQVNHSFFLTLVSLSAILDLFDGWAARYWQQESRFGEWFDVVIDLFSRGFLWNLVLPEFGFLIFGWEFLIFVSTHSSGQHWQNNKHLKLHWLASKTVSKGFKSPLGVLAISGLWLSPIWFYIINFNVFDVLNVCSKGTILFISAGLAVSRIFCLFVEACFLQIHILILLDN